MQRLFIFIFFLLTHATAIFSQGKITVVGAGLAGLTAAYRLKQKGYTCEVYEARSRPGGRVFTAYFKDSYDELGGKNVYDGGTGETILALIEELGLETEVFPMHLPGVTFFDGTVRTQPDLLKGAPPPNESAFLALEEKTRTLHSLGELIDSFLAQHPAVRTYMHLCMNTWEGSSTYLLPPEYLSESFWEIYNKQYNLAHTFLSGKTSQRVARWVKGGNSRLIATLTEPLNGHVHYNRPLRKIARGADHPIALHFDNEIIATDYLILAIPCSTLRDVEIGEGLFPDDQMHAIRTLQYGTNAKLIFPIKAEELHTNVAFTENWVFFITNTKVMTWYCGEETGIFNAHDTTSLIEKEMPKFLKMFPSMQFPQGTMTTPTKEQLFVQYDKPVAISWTNEEFSKGSYSNYGLGTFAFFNEFIDEYGENLRKVFRCIDGRIVWAGEHTAKSGENGTMEGAVYSGERAARITQRLVGIKAASKAIGQRALQLAQLEN